MAASPFSLVGAVFGNSSINLAWNANSEPDIAGYLILCGTASGVYPNTVDVHNVITAIPFQMDWP